MSVNRVIGRPEATSLTQVKPRLRHVAEVAGVSQATVSRVLNGRTGVADDTRREVLRAVADLGYEVPATRPERRGGLIGLIVPELDNPIFPRFAQAIESRLAGQGLVTLLCTSTPAGMQESDELDVLLDHAISGLVIVSGAHADVTGDHRRYHELADRRLPVVLVNGRAEGIDLPVVETDHVGAARQAVAHLASLGHRRIGLATGPGRYLPTRALGRGYRLGLQDAGLTVDPDLLVEAHYGLQGGDVAGRALLAAGATAAVCASDLVALGVIGATRDAGCHVPRDLSVVGFDDAGPSPHLDPPLTSLRQPVDAMAAAVVDLLLERLTDPRLAATDLRFAAELVVRASTAPPPSGSRPR